MIVGPQQVRLGSCNRGLGRDVLETQNLIERSSEDLGRGPARQALGNPIEEPDMALIIDGHDGLA